MLPFLFFFLKNWLKAQYLNFSHANLINVEKKGFP